MDNSVRASLRRNNLENTAFYSAMNVLSAVHVMSNWQMKKSAPSCSAQKPLLWFRQLQSVQQFLLYMNVASLAPFSKGKKAGLQNGNLSPALDCNLFMTILTPYFV